VLPSTLHTKILDGYKKSVFIIIFFTDVFVISEPDLVENRLFRTREVTIGYAALFLAVECNIFAATALTA
jgi:hypothetical protein